jgi:hypothetical protein
VGFGDRAGGAFVHRAAALAGFGDRAAALAGFGDRAAALGGFRDRAAALGGFRDRAAALGGLVGAAAAANGAVQQLAWVTRGRMPCSRRPALLHKPTCIVGRESAAQAWACAASGGVLALRSGM